MCCNRSNQSWNRSARWNRSCCCGNSDTWDLSQTGNSCYLSVPNFLCASSANSASERNAPRFTVSGTIDQFLIENSNSGCTCG